MATELLVQVKLQSDTTVLTCWVNRHVKAGDIVTLSNSDDPFVRWVVMEVYEHATKPEHGWHVGGM